MILFKHNNNSKNNFDLRSITDLELMSLKQGNELLLENSKNILLLSEKEQKKVFLNMTLPQNPNETKQDIQKQIDENFETILDQLVSNHQMYERIQKILSIY